MRCVLDSSAALAWVLPGESDDTTDALLSNVADQGAIAPGIWPLEIANVLWIAQRRGRMTLAERLQALALLSDLPVQIDTGTAARAWSSISALAASRGLTVYDASYLELALRLALPLASADKDLRQAAVVSGVLLIG